MAAPLLVRVTPGGRLAAPPGRGGRPDAGV